MNKTVPAVSDEMVEAMIEEMNSRCNEPRYKWFSADDFEPNPDYLPNDDTQLGVEFAIEFMNKNSAALAAQGQSAAVKALEWSEVSKPTDNCRYDHTKAPSIVGEYSIEWKSWKDHDDYTIFLNGEWIGSGGWGEGALEKARAAAQADYAARILSQVITAPAQPVGVPEGWRLVPVEPTEEMMHKGRWGGITPLDENRCINMAGIYRAMLAAAPQPPAEGGWKPMDSAPKDGTEILVYGRKEGGGYYRDVQSWPGDWVGSWPVEYMGYAAGGPLGWMPLPPAPANGGDTHG